MGWLSCCHPDSYRDWNPPFWLLFFPARFIIHSIHSLRLSAGCSSIATFKATEVCFFMSRIIFSRLSPWVPTIMWIWLLIPIAIGTPAKYFKAFMKLAMFPAFQHDVLIFVTDKKVNPVYHSKAYKIKLVLVPEFIFGAHDSLNVHYLIGNAKINKPFRRTTCQRGTSASTSFSPRRHSRQAMGYWVSCPVSNITPVRM